MEMFINTHQTLKLHSYILPLTQGYWQTVSFQVPAPLTPSAEDELPPDPSLGLSSIPVDYTVISRRSRDRAGLRYQRRGADDSGNVANFVETEAVAIVTVRKSIGSLVESNSWATERRTT